MHSKTKVWIVALLIPLAVGALSALFTSGSMEEFASLRQPPLSPPGFIFPIVWTILFLLMGAGSALLYLSQSPVQRSALKTYVLQLAVNFLWSIIFFAFGARFFALLWILLLLFLVIRMILLFYKAVPLAAYLQIPYLAWILFATYLNAGVWFLNR